MNQTMPIVKVKDLGIALAAYIAQKRRTNDNPRNNRNGTTSRKADR